MNTSRHNRKLRFAGPLTIVLLIGFLPGGPRSLADDLADKQPEAGTLSRQVSAKNPETSELLVFLTPGSNPDQFAKDHGVEVKYRLESDPDGYVVAAVSSDVAKATCSRAATDSRVVQSYLNEHTNYVKWGFTPNDPYFHRNTPTSPWPGQWYLVNEYVPGRDANVQGAWNRDITGSGVVIGIVDDSFETTHPDLAPAYSAADSWDFGQGDSDPNPVYLDDEHGIAVAGVAAARGGNGIGICGAAPLAGLAGLRVDFHTQTQAMFVDATLYHSSGADTTIKVKNHSYGFSNPYVDASAAITALATSAAVGTIHCCAAGNERGYSGQDSNKNALASSPHVIAVTALGSDGTYADYSNFGSCVFVTAPSNSFKPSHLFGITTTDRSTEAFGYTRLGDSFPDADYTSMFGGTSSASPLVAGVMALGKQAQPHLDARFAKHILARTCTLVDPADATLESDEGWKTNAAGFKFNQNYGFGLINADQFTLKAAQYVGVTPLTIATTNTVTVNATIPDNDSNGISQTFTLMPLNPQPMEEVLVTLNIKHPYRGDIEAYIVSPAGTSSRLMIRSSRDRGFGSLNWTFCTNAFWGENPAGDWSLRVRDVGVADMGTWNSFAVVACMGDLIAHGPDPLVAEAGPDRLINCGGSIVVEGSATGGTSPYSFKWTPNIGLSTPTSDPLTASPSSKTTYTLTVTDSGGNTASDTVTVDVAPSPHTLTQQPLAQSVCLGSTATFTVVATSANTLTYQWQKGQVNLTDGGHYADTATAKLTISGVDTNDAAAYRCIVTEPCGSIITEEARLSLTPPVAISRQPQSQQVCAGGTIAFQVGAIGSGQLTYQWQKNAINLYDDGHCSGTATPALAVSGVNVSDAGEYRCTVIGECNQAISDSVSLAVKPAVSLTGQPLDQDVIVGETAVFTVTAQGDGSLNYRWQHAGTDLIDDGRIFGATTATLAITETGPDDTGQYRCVVTDECGRVLSTDASLTVTTVLQTRAPQGCGTGVVPAAGMSVLGLLLMRRKD